MMCARPMGTATAAPPMPPATRPVAAYSDDEVRGILPAGKIIAWLMLSLFLWALLAFLGGGFA